MICIFTFSPGRSGGNGGNGGHKFDGVDESVYNCLKDLKKQDEKQVAEEQVKLGRNKMIFCADFFIFFRVEILHFSLSRNTSKTVLQIFISSLNPWQTMVIIPEKKPYFPF